LRTITLFSESADLSGQPVSFLASILIHGLVAGLIVLVFIHTPRIDNRTSFARYMVRNIDLQTPEQRTRSGAAGSIRFPGPRSASSALAASGNQLPHQLVLRQVIKARPGPQTLLQPDLNANLTLAQVTPVPQLMVWLPSKAPARNIVPPAPQKPPSADVTPALDLPNEEVKLADIPFTSTNRLTLHPLVTASTTTPVVQQGSRQAQVSPVTVSQPAAQSTPATVLSLSDLQMKNGKATLPPVNETSASSSPGGLAPGDDKQPAPGKNNSVAKSAAARGPADRSSTGKDAAGGGTGAGTQSPAAGSSAASSTARIATSDAGSANDAGAGPARTDAGGSSMGGQFTSTRITLARDGHFGAVVIGTSLEDQYPELGDVWRGRMAYTVYLHVGLAKSWILQYSLPRSTDAAQGGGMQRLDAPWPYSIVRPNIAPGAIDAEVLMIHGFISQEGHFDALTILFPQDFSQSAFLLKALNQWEFRPAAQNGQNARIEVLLIIPDQGD
jgi:hypothetical protein